MLAKSTLLLNLIIQELSRYMSDATILGVLRWTPFPPVQRLVKISDTMARRSKEIVSEKKALLDKGDSAMQLQIGEGKDIMSILRQYCGY